MAGEQIIEFSVGPVRYGTRSRSIPHNPNSRLHHMVRYQWNKIWKTEVQFRTLAQHLPAEGLWERSRVTFTFCTIRPVENDDEDNKIASIKPLLDGLKGIVIPDDSRKYVELHVKQEQVARRSEEHVHVLVERLG